MVASESPADRTTNAGNEDAWGERKGGTGMAKKRVWEVFAPSIVGEGRVGKFEGTKEEAVQQARNWLVAQAQTEKMVPVELHEQATVEGWVREFLAGKEIPVKGTRWQRSLGEGGEQTSEAGWLRVEIELPGEPDANETFKREDELVREFEGRYGIHEEHGVSVHFDDYGWQKRDRDKDGLA